MSLNNVDKIHSEMYDDFINNMQKRTVPCIPLILYCLTGILLYYYINSIRNFK